MIGIALADLSAPLSSEQSVLLNVMANAFFADGQWPVWDYVQRMMSLERLDADEVLKSLPVVGSSTGIGPSYGLVIYDRTHVAKDSRPALTIAAGLHLPRFAASVGRPFLLVLQTMVELEQNAPISTSTVVEVHLTPQSVKRSHPSISDVFMKWLFDLLANEPPTRGGGSSVAPDTGDWSRGIQRQIVTYEGVRDLPTYVARVSDWVMANAPVLPQVDYAVLPQQTVWASSAPAVDLGSVSVRRVQYVDEALIEELEAAGESAPWHFGKLAGLLRELNSNVADEHAYACDALLRAILDHVPPIFNTTAERKFAFDQVVSIYPWSRTDRSYMAQLKDFRARADDVMHRQIRKSPDLIRMEDFPPRTPLNALLRGLVDALPSDKQAVRGMKSEIRRSKTRRPTTTSSAACTAQGARRVAGRSLPW